VILSHPQFQRHFIGLSGIILELWMRQGELDATFKNVCNPAQVVDFRHPSASFRLLQGCDNIAVAVKQFKRRRGR
jgi:hypothetical protein